MFSGIFIAVKSIVYFSCKKLAIIRISKYWFKKKYNLGIRTRRLQLSMHT